MLETHMSRTTAQQQGRFKNYLERHCLAWYKFASDNDILVDFGDIILVTECSKTAAWASAVYSQNSKDFSLQFSVGGAFLPIQSGVGVSAGYGTLCSVQHRRSQRRAITPADVEEVPNDQTVFIKGYRPGPRHLYSRSFACKLRNLMHRQSRGHRSQKPQGSSPSGSESGSIISSSGSPSDSHSSPNIGTSDFANGGDFEAFLALESPVSSNFLVNTCLDVNLSLPSRISIRLLLCLPMRWRFVCTLLYSVNPNHLT